MAPTRSGLARFFDSAARSQKTPNKARAGFRPRKSLVDQSARFYNRLLPETTPKPDIKVRNEIQIVSRNIISNSGTTQLRCNQPAEYLQSLGYSVGVSNIYTSVPSASKIVILNRCIFDFYTRLFVFVSRLRGCAIAYDIDDLLFDSDGQNHLSTLPNRGGSAFASAMLYASAMSGSDLVIVSTDFLKERATALVSQCVVLRNAVSKAYMTKSELVRRTPRHRGCVTVAYLSGSKTHDADFAVVADDICRLMESFSTVRLLIVGHLNIPNRLAAFGERVLKKEFVAYDDYPMLFSEIDINLSPLEEQAAFCKAKSELKYIEAAACEVMTVASPTPAYVAAIRDGENGRLAAKGEWYEVLKSLVEDPATRVRLAAHAFEDFEKNYSPGVRTKDWKDVVAMLEGVVAARKPMRGAIFADERIAGLLFSGLQYQRRLQRWLARFVKAMRRQPGGEIPLSPRA